jgi:excinuclease ABC subunit B
VPGLSSKDAGRHAAGLAGLPSKDLADLVQQLTDQMHTAAAELQFELAARLRDEISDLKKELRQMVEAGAR